MWTECEKRHRLGETASQVCEQMGKWCKGVRSTERGGVDFRVSKGIVLRRVGFEISRQAHGVTGRQLSEFEVEVQGLGGARFGWWPARAGQREPGDLRQPY